MGIQDHPAEFSILTCSSPKGPLNCSGVKKARVVVGSDFPTSFYDSLEGVTLNYVNKGRIPLEARVRENHMKKKISDSLAFIFILVHSGCCNNVPQTGWLLNNRHLFLTILGPKSLRSWAQLGPVRAISQVPAFPCIFTW